MERCMSMFVQASSKTEAMPMMTGPRLSPSQQTLQREQRSDPFYDVLLNATPAMQPLHVGCELGTRKILRSEQV